ncbi:MAG: MBL fold metallo-hydrolase [Methylotenera sp.]|jgi:sulfur dioxygenase
MFRQLFDEATSTLTYLLVDEETKDAVIIDPVREHIDDYVKLVEQLKVNLLYALETHVHADHVTASGLLRSKLDVKVAVSQQCGAQDADLQLNEGDVIHFGKQHVQVIATPGHTAGSLTFLWQDKLFTGDALLINGCGRTDFQSGDAATLFDSIVNKLFTYPNETLIYPGHDYSGHRVSNIAQEKLINPRLANQTKEAFIQIMENLNLPKPKMIDIAVPANRNCGISETEILQG